MFGPRPITRWIPWASCGRNTPRSSSSAPSSPTSTFPTTSPLHSFCFENISEFHNRPCIINGSTARSTPTRRRAYLPQGRIRSQPPWDPRRGMSSCSWCRIPLSFVFSFLGTSYRGAISTTANPFNTPRGDREAGCRFPHEARGHPGCIR
ncbi:hypothetical protein MLD38_014039 [Melastoma candidum]|uniref:Uncharacterized protein n=1 Tax=Melastoma candidum TaxID=119954 RepID=A0ACB9RBJ5_9MYRT|nr:hypothetical protein MLD38_014039 [Melastoma candidum]